MNTKDLECILKIAEEQNLTRAAQKLYLTAPALTQKLAALEKDLNCTLFERSRNGCFPTSAGEIYIRFAQSILNQESDLKKQLEELQQQAEETITIGFPPERGSSIFSNIYPLFRKAYPNVSIHLVEANVHTQQELIAKGKIDLGFVTLLEEQKIDNSYLKLHDEELLFVAPKKIFSGEQNPLPDIDLRQFQQEPFALMQTASTTRIWQDKILESFRIQPKIAFETSRSNTILNMVSLGFCCSLISDFYFDPKIKDVQYATLPEHPKWSMYISYRKNAYLSPAMRAFIDMTVSFYKSEA